MMHRVNRAKKKITQALMRRRKRRKRIRQKVDWVKLKMQKMEKVSAEEHHFIKNHVRKKGRKRRKANWKLLVRKKEDLWR
jgi:hypothetical protein